MKNLIEKEKNKVNIREILERQIEIEAENLMEAQAEVEQQYQDEKIVLDENDYKGTEISVQQLRKIQEKELEDARRKQEEYEFERDKEPCKIKSGVR